MRKRWIWLVLFVVAIVGAVLMGWNWHQGRLLFATESRYQPLSSEQSSLAAPLVNSQRLLTDVEALSFKRYTEVDRHRARNYLMQALQDAGWQAKTQGFEGGINIYAERPGTDPEAGSILLAAHYDTVESSPGADDNATSVAAVLEAARLLGQQTTPRTLQIALFDLEEVGLLGSTAFAEQVAHPENLRGVIVMDMIGYACYEEGCQSFPPLPITPPTNRGDFLAVIGDQGHPFLIDSFTQTNPAGLPQVLTLAVPTFGRLTPDLMRSDHVPFWRKGIGAVLITDTANFRNPHYHQPSDTPDTIDREFLAGAAQIIVNATTALLTQSS